MGVGNWWRFWVFGGGVFGHGSGVVVVVVVFLGT